MISVTISSDPSEADGHWDDLVRRGSANVFMTPCALRAVRATGFADIRVLSAWDQDVSPRKLVGWWALRVRRILPFWPAVLEALPYNYAFLSNPVVDPLCADAVIPAFLAALRASRFLPRVLSLPSFDNEGPSAAALQRIVSAKGATRLSLSDDERPVVTREFGVKRSGSTRKKLRQDWNRLAALGAVEVVNARQPDQATDAFEAFLSLELSSWKGREGTALLSSSKDAGFVRQLIGNLAAKNQASVALLVLGEQPIAAQVLLYCGTTAYTWKTAYDAEFARFSPGALLVDKVTEQLFAVPGIDTIDSCAAQASFMGQLWSGRRAMVDLLVDLRPGGSLAFRLETVRRRAYVGLKALYHRLRAPKPAALPQPVVPRAGT